MSYLFKDIWDWARVVFGLAAAHILGTSNVEADQLSQNLNFNLEWMLLVPVFRELCLYLASQIFIFLPVDLCSSRDICLMRPSVISRFYRSCIFSSLN